MIRIIIKMTEIHVIFSHKWVANLIRMKYELQKSREVALYKLKCKILEPRARSQDISITKPCKSLVFYMPWSKETIKKSSRSIAYFFLMGSTFIVYNSMHASTYKSYEPSCNVFPFFKCFFFSFFFFSKYKGKWNEIGGQANTFY